MAKATKNQNSKGAILRNSLTVVVTVIFLVAFATGCNGMCPEGYCGQKGDTGANGVNGTNGVNGVNGANGTNGVNGVNGANGTNGKDGTSCYGKVDVNTGCVQIFCAGAKVGAPLCGCTVEKSGQVGCVDIVCGGTKQTVCAPTPSTPEACQDGVDNDGDGLIDCADPDCATYPACLPPLPICGNGVCDTTETVQTCPADCTVPPPACSLGHGAQMYLPAGYVWTMGRDLTGSEGSETETAISTVNNGGQWLSAWSTSAWSIWAWVAPWNTSFPQGVMCIDRCGNLYGGKPKPGFPNIVQCTQDGN